jgi:hypothetical protein
MNNEFVKEEIEVGGPEFFQNIDSLKQQDNKIMYFILKCQFVGLCKDCLPQFIKFLFIMEIYLNYVNT